MFVHKKSTVYHHQLSCSAALVTANRDFYPVVNSWANSEMILADPLNQLASCNNECCKAITQLVRCCWVTMKDIMYRYITEHREYADISAESQGVSAILCHSAGELLVLE